MDRHQWAHHLAAVAAPALAGTPLDPATEIAAPEDLSLFIEAFRDELGHRRAIDRPLLGRLLGAHQAPDQTPGHTPCGSPEPVATHDRHLWWGLVSDQQVEDVISDLLDGTGPLIGEAEFARGAIEATTETELGALHAFAHYADIPGFPADRIRARTLDAARWHVDTLQPDNGTNHPWAIHVFVGLAEADPAYAMPASLHAEGLLHNAVVRSGRPDRFSACLLIDAARALAQAAFWATEPG
jgi:hypothetical protein